MYTLYMVLAYCFQIYSYLMIAWILMSWVPNLRYTKIGQVLGTIVEPYLSIFRRFIPPLGGIDLSPIVAFIVYRIIVNFILGHLLPLLLGF